jgi:hypothetical protein
MAISLVRAVVVVHIHGLCNQHKVLPVGVQCMSVFHQTSFDGSSTSGWVGFIA